VIEEELGMQKEQNCFAYEVLREYGNMSSATVVFVLSRIWSELRETDSDKKILSFAFGPGLTMESMLLSVETV
jgi:predicted naringenin-chalcone synthase